MAHHGARLVVVGGTGPMLFDFREAHSVAITGPVAVQVPGSRRQATQLFDSARQQAADLDVITEGDEISSGEL